MKNLKKLSRKRLGNVKGGDEGCSYKCCSDRNPQICSGSVTVPIEQSGSVSCSSGSHLVAV
ncbi:bacteriocin-like protein [Chryseobacterium phosphatilyticum]|uniref:bacteriocin-like protein n=1 Tax=Chryseobacterium phosphatilyticum TaxID=475075 RepID=UPI000F4F23F9|nr:hypothetical protein [Chryseobacterium phosphatilyticum]